MRRAGAGGSIRVPGGESPRAHAFQCQPGPGSLASAPAARSGPSSARPPLGPDPSPTRCLSAGTRAVPAIRVGLKLSPRSFFKPPGDRDKGGTRMGLLPRRCPPAQCPPRRTMPQRPARAAPAASLFARLTTARPHGLPRTCDACTALVPDSPLVGGTGPRESSLMLQAVLRQQNNFETQNASKAAGFKALLVIESILSPSTAFQPVRKGNGGMAWGDDQERSHQAGLQGVDEVCGSGGVAPMLFV